MKKILATLALGALSVFTAQAQTQKKFSFNIGPDVALPIGDWHNFYSFGIGGTAKAGVRVFDQGAVTLTAGYLNFLGKDYDFGLVTIEGSSVGYIPVKAGFQYLFGPVYIEPQLGVGTFTGDGNSSTGFAYAGLVGVKAGVLDVSARYEGVSKDKNTNSFVGLRVAFGF